MPNGPYTSTLYLTYVLMFFCQKCMYFCQKKKREGEKMANAF